MSLYKKNLYRFPLSLSVQYIDPKKHIPVLIEIEKKCFPLQMQESRQDFAAFLDDEYAIGWLLCRDGKGIGYLLGSHLSEANSADILSTNKFIQEHQDVTFYLSSIAILKEERSVVVFDFFLHEAHKNLIHYDYHYVTSHARKKRGYSRMLQRRFQAVLIKSYKNWNNYNEPFDYLLMDMTKTPILPKGADFFFKVLRWIRSRIRALTSRDVDTP